MEAYIGAIYAFGFNFAPVGWALCNGQLLNISEYEALYALIGNTFGGNGTSNFAVPNLQSRVPIGTGHGTGLSNYALGANAGTEEVTMTTANIPAHTHNITVQVPVSTSQANQSDPTNAYFALSDTAGLGGNTYASTGGTAMAVNTSLSSAYGNSSALPISILNPVQAVNYCICCVGLYPMKP